MVVEISCLERFKSMTCEGKHAFHLHRQTLMRSYQMQYTESTFVHHSGRDLYFYLFSYL